MTLTQKDAKDVIATGYDMVNEFMTTVMPLYICERPNGVNQL